MKRRKSFRREQGNTLFLILVAVALFAALSYAITQSGRGGVTLDRETARIRSSQIMQYAALLRAIVTRMVLSGISADAIDFTTGTGTTKVFDASGGGATLLPPPPEIGNATSWIFQDVMTPANSYYVKGVGTDLAAGCEALAVLEDITPGVCSQILSGLGAASSTPLPADVQVIWGAGGNDFDVDGSTIKGIGIDGNTFLCIQNGAMYTYYHTLFGQ
ncbi:MAG: hypothetical protein V1721_02895 [Pseudomonadota bacterium]